MEPPILTIDVAGIDEDSITNGPGLRYVLFVQGCPHHCIGCHNPQTHRFHAGRLFTVEELFRQIRSNPLQTGITFSGGEPFCQPEALYELGSRFKAAGKHLMCYSGWTFEELLKKSGREEYVGKLLSILDVLVDGRFDISKRSLSLLFRGSSNQRLIDVPSSLTNGEAVELPE